jgi:hypothetical protein
MSKVAFVASKPLQILVCISIIDEAMNHSDVDLIITNDFYDSENIVQKLKEHLKIAAIRNILYFENQSLAYSYLATNHYSNIFIDSDVGFKRYLELLRIKINNISTQILVYEEGLGTYRNDIYKTNSISSRIKVGLLMAVGVGVVFGGNFLTKSIFLFSPNEYCPIQKKNTGVVLIKNTVEQTITKFELALSSVFNPQTDLVSALAVRPNTCTIYLSSWTISDKFLARLVCARDLIIIKLHPHIKTKPNPLLGCIYIHHSMPAEILLTIASKYCDSITVFHHGTSATRYISRQNIKYKLIED